MKTLNEYINEKLNLDDDGIHTIVPKSRMELTRIIKKMIEENDYDFSKIYVGDLNDLSNVFAFVEIKHDINVTGWDVSKVKNMEGLFSCGINNDIIGVEDWDVSNVESMANMFAGCTAFNGDLSDWKVKNVKDFNGMFSDCTTFMGKGLENWDVSNGDQFQKMFNNCKRLKCDLSNWNIKEDAITKTMFKDCLLGDSKKPKL